MRRFVNVNKVVKKLEALKESEPLSSEKAEKLGFKSPEAFAYMSGFKNGIIESAIEIVRGGGK